MWTFVANLNPKEPHLWLEPWRKLLKLLNMVTAHAVGIFVIVVIRRVLEWAINLVSPLPLVWTANGVTVSLGEMANYFDLAVILAFFAVALFDLAKWAFWR